MDKATSDYIDKIAEEAAKRILAIGNDDYSAQTIKAQIAGAIVKVLERQRKAGND